MLKKRVYFMMAFMFLMLFKTKAQSLAVPQLSGVFQSGTQEITCSLFDKSLGEDGHYVQTATSPSGPWTLVQTVPASVGTSVFRITLNLSYPSNVTNTIYLRSASFITGPPLNMTTWSTPISLVYSNQAPAPPINFGIAALSETSAYLSFSPSSPNQDYYILERDNADLVYRQVAQLGTFEQIYQESGLKHNTFYTYRIKACNELGCSDWTYATVLTKNGTPVAPGTVGLVSLKPTEMYVSWSDLSSNENGFVIQRADENGVYATISTVQANQTNFVDLNLVPRGRYFYRVASTNQFATSSFTNLGEMRVLDGAPSDIQVSLLDPDSPDSVSIAWKDNTSNEIGFNIFRTGQTGTEVLIGSTSANVTKFIDRTTVEKSSYEYAIQTKYAGNLVSSKTKVLFVTPAGKAPLSPVLTEKTNIEKEVVTLNWTNVAREESYVIEKSFDDKTFTTLATLKPEITTFVDSTLSKSEESFYYRVIAVNKYGKSPNSNTVLVSIPRKPAAPSELVAKVVNFKTIQLNWKDNSINEDGFAIEKATGAGTFEKVITLAANSTTFIDSTNKELTEYTYRIKSVNAKGESVYLTTTKLKTPFKVILAPTKLTAEAIGFAEVLLKWQDNNDHEAGYTIERSIDNIKFEKLTDLGANIVTYSDKNVSDNATYYYKMVARNVNDTSDYTPSVKVSVPLRPLNPPTGLTASALSDEEIALVWQDKEGIETGYDVERSTDGTAFTKIATLPANSTTYLNTGLLQLTKYFYRVRAVNSVQNSTYSNIADATTKITTGFIKEKVNLEVKTYPNPVIDYLTIEHPENMTKISVLSQFGISLQTKEINKSASSTRLDLNNLNAGLYLVKIEGQQKSIVKKIIKN